MRRKYIQELAQNLIKSAVYVSTLLNFDSNVRYLCSVCVVSILGQGCKPTVDSSPEHSFQYKGVFAQTVIRLLKREKSPLFSIMSRDSIDCH